MKHEQIIANIERYVATLDSEMQQMFNKSLEQAENERKAVKKLFSAECAPLLELAEIIQELKAEMKQAELKAAGGASLVKRTKLLNKLLAKCNREICRSGFHADIRGEKMQCSIIDGFYAFMFRQDLDIPMQQSTPIAIGKCIPDYSNFTKCEFDLAAIKTALKLSKAKKETRCRIEINGREYDAAYLINVIEILGGDITMYHDANGITAAVFESENGLAILMPLRKERV